MLQIIIIFIVVAADQLSKFILVPVLEALPGKTLPVIENLFHLTYVKNYGASFGMLQGMRVFFIIVTFIVLAAVGFYMVRGRKTHPRFLRVCLALLFGGALGNLIDRIVFTHVRDLFEFRLSFFPWVFNVADSCLVIGAILLGIYMLFIHKDKGQLGGILGDGKDAPNGGPEDKKR